VSGSPFGNFYSEPMRNSPTLTGSVLEKFEVTIRINELGFRESSDIDSTEIFTLGDSFTFGWGVNEQESWPGLLETRLNRPIYNLGIHDASPRQELELLSHVLRQHGGTLRVRKLLWMIYEGNDLEDDYTEEVQRHDASVKVPLTRGTLIDAMERLMWTIKRQSVIHKLRRGQITWKTSKDNDASNPYNVDGVSLVYPLYYSGQLGPRLFSSTYVDLAGESAGYVENHWNRAALESVFRDMKSLADQHDFEVAVILAPTASRLHGPYFDNFPEISERPYFLDFIRELSESAGFSTVDLYELMRPHAGRELLYFRDDDHFNHRGNALAAELIEQNLFATPN
jgi:lysophospholipase L1-like esterase